MEAVYLGRYGGNGGRERQLSANDVCVVRFCCPSALEVAASGSNTLDTSLLFLRLVDCRMGVKRHWSVCEWKWFSGFRLPGAEIRSWFEYVMVGSAHPCSSRLLLPLLSRERKLNK